MKKVIIFNCPVCNHKMYFDNYVDNYVCKDCNKKFPLSSLKNLKEEIDEDLEPKKIKINFSEKEYFYELKRIKNKLSLAKKDFLKIKTITKEDIKTLYLPIFLVNATIILNLKDESYKYNIKDYPYLKGSNFDIETLEKIMPINYIEQEEVTKNDYQNIEISNHSDILKKIEKEINSVMKDRIELDYINEDYNMLIPELEINYLLVPIYDYTIKCEGQDYHFTMNANTKKFNCKIIYDKKKLIYLESTFLLLDILIFALIIILKFSSPLLIAIPLFVIELVVFILL